MTSDILFNALLFLLSINPFVDKELIEELKKEEYRTEIEIELMEDFKNNPEEWNRIVEDYLKEVNVNDQ